MDIITNPSLLRVVCEPVSLKEGGEIARKLTFALERHNKKAKRPGSRDPLGIGLSAPQLGIRKRVFVTCVGTPRAFVNPVIIRRSETEVLSDEGCLSLPGVVREVRRRLWVTVQCDNWRLPVTFGPNPPGKKPGQQLLEAMAVQHETDHLNGVTIQDRGVPCGDCAGDGFRVTFGQNQLPCLGCRSVGRRAA